MPSKGQTLENTFVKEIVEAYMPVIYKLASRRKQTEVKHGFETREGRYIIGWEEIASQIETVLKTKYPDDRPEVEKEYVSAVGQIPKIHNAFQDGIKPYLLTTDRDGFPRDKSRKDKMQLIVGHLNDELVKLFRKYKRQTNLLYSIEVKRRSSSETRDLFPLDMTRFIQQAKAVLELTTTEAEVSWEDVSCAVALVTGRRMAEIHLSAEFSTIEGETHQLMFKGQLKGKTRKVSLENGELVRGDKKVRDVGFPIETLVSSDLVLAGMKYLEDKSRRLPKNGKTLDVNAKFSKPLSAAIRNRWSFIEWNAKEYDLSIPKEYEGTSKERELKTTYHKLRSAYFLLCLENCNVTDPRKVAGYITRILGDSSTEAQDAYDRFSIREGSITRI